MSDSLKEKTGFALFWNFIDKGGQQLIQFIIGWVLARILSPDEFGLVAVLTIFTVIANLLQESGFSSALIRKKIVSPQEYSTVFYFNVSVSFFIYAVLFFCAPLISDFYNKPILTNLSRFVFLAFIFNAFGIIQNVNLAREMNFKTNTRISLIAGCTSGIIAVIMAVYGYGVWSLAMLAVLQTFLRNILLWIFVKWSPKGGFSYAHLREMAPYSSKLLFSNIFNQVCNNIYVIIISDRFSFRQGGLYSQANKFNMIPQSIIGDSIRTAAYPMLTQVGDDLERKKRAYRKIIRITSFITFPITLMILVLAKPIILVTLGNQWVEAVPILQVIAIGGIFYPIRTLIAPLLQALGKSGTLMSLEVVKNILLLLSIVISIRWGVMGLVWGMGIVNLLHFWTEMHFTGRNIGYTLRELLADMAPYFLFAAVSILPMYLFNEILGDKLILMAIIQAVLGGLIYLLITKLSGSVILDESIQFVRNLTKRK